VAGKTQLSVEVRGRQHVRNVHLGVVVWLLLVTGLAVLARSGLFGWSAPARDCLRATEVVQAAGLASVVGLLLLELRALEALLIPPRRDDDRARARVRSATYLGIGSVLAGLSALVGLATTVVATLRASAPVDGCPGAVLGGGTGEELFWWSLLALVVLVGAAVVRSVRDLPRSATGTQPRAFLRTRDQGAPEGTVICCSGGGIRSAAFCLGGLQALDATPAPGAPVEPGQPPPTLYSEAREVVGVSGGGYMAAAWHVARHPKPLPIEPLSVEPSRRSRFRFRRSRVAGDPDGAINGAINGAICAAVDPGANGKGAGEGGGRGAALTGLDLDLEAKNRPFGADSPELRRLRRTTTYLASSGRVRVDGALSWLYGTAAMWGVVLAAISLATWTLSLFADRLDLAAGLGTSDATAWPSAFVGWACVVLLALGPLAFFLRRMVLMRTRRRRPGRMPDWLQNSVAPAMAVGSVVTALLLGVPGVAVLLHDTTVRNQPVPLVANIVHTLGFAPPAACDAATSDQRFREVFEQNRARAQAAGSPVTFGFGACGSVVDVRAAPDGDATKVSQDARKALTFAPGVWQQLAASGAAVAFFGGLVRSVLKGRRQEQPTGRGGSTLTFLRRRVAPYLATALALAAGFLLLVKWFDDDLLVLRRGDPGSARAYLEPVLFFGLLLVLKTITSATWMSMHPFYRDRLRATYLLRRTGYDAEGRPEVEPVEEPDLEFTDHEGKPDLVLCGTANLSDDELVPSGRQGAPFLFTGGEIGFDDPCNLPPGGVVPARKYAAATTDVRISAAMAISGAALAPVMARENKNVRPFRLLMALCNVRTGVWLPNPYWVHSISGLRGQKGLAGLVSTLGERSAVPGVGAVLREGLGRTSLMSRRIYVTDGGQLENLGLVVALRRRPATVYVLDASGDPPNTFSTLAQAMAMARIDRHVEFEGPDLTPLMINEQGYSASAAAGATIEYDDGSKGRLVYVKALVPEHLPWDVEGYRRLDSAFPMTGTEDQLYGEFDFEAYRELGWAVTKAALDARLDLGPESKDGAHGEPSPKAAGAAAWTPAEAPVPRPFSP
jgi:hypothetical protein